MNRSNRSSTQRSSSFLTRLLAVLSFTLFFAWSSALAQGTTGSIAGTVLDEAQGNFLEGAEIAVDGTAMHTTSARGGAFDLTGVPAGAYTVTITYPGMAPASIAVTVTAGQTAQVSAKLNSDVIQLAEFSVKSNREGMSQAIAIQKVSIQSKMVAASDQFGPVSEGNVGEYLKFLPGVTVDYNVNDARGLSLRGLSTAYTVVAVDGTPMAGTSSMDDTRRFEFEQIAMNNVETTELFKTVTPDIPANATGGFVNFVTKSAFDHQEESRLTYDLSFSTPGSNLSFGKQGGVWGHQNEWTIRPNLEANYSRKINEKLGVNFNYRLSEKYDDSPRTIATWNVTSSATAPTIFTAAPRLLSYQVRSEEKLTHREAFATKLDYHLSDATKLTLSGQWNWYDLNFTQRGPTFTLGTGSTVSGNTYTSGTGAGAAGASVTNGVLYRNKYGTTVHVNGTVEHDFSDKSKATLTAYWSRADGQYRDTQKGFISSSSVMNPSSSTYTGIVINDLSKELPGITLMNGTNPVSLDLVRSLGTYTFSNTTGTGFQSRPWSAVDKKKGVSGNYTYELDTTKMPLKLEAGFAIDTVLRNITRLDLRGNIPSTTGTALAALADPLYTRDVAFGFGSYQAVDPFKVWDAFKDKLTILSVNDVRQFDEDNSAVFVRADLNVTPDLLVIGGVRGEKRTINAQAQSKANGRSKAAVIDLDYSQLYPSLSFKFTPKNNHNIVVRGGFSRTVGHPDYADLVPTIISQSADNAKDGSINVPDPSLKPYFASNFDLSLDYYFKNSGVVSIYGFRKNVKNYFISHTMNTAEINTVATEYGYNPAEFSSGAVTSNGGKSRLQGVELSYAQNLTFLPKPFNGLNVQANFTYVDIEASDPDPMRALDTWYSQSRAVSPKTANLILGYRYKDLSFTSTTNWVSESLFGGFVATSFFTGSAANTTTGAPDTRLALYRNDKPTTDMKLEYSFNKHFAAYFLVRNVFNSQRIDFYRGYLTQNRNVVLPLNRYEFGEPHLTLGLRGRF